MMRRSCVVLLVFALALALVTTAHAQEPQLGGTLRIAMNADPLNLDPAMLSSLQMHQVTALMYPTLLKYDANMNLVPHLAESFEIIDDETYEFRLRQGIMFWHGRELVAQDVAYSILRIQDPDVPSPEAHEVAAVAEIEVIDDYTLRIKTDGPFAPTLQGLTFGMGVHPQEKVEEWGDLRVRASGTGPFRLIEYIPDERLVLERFDDFWEGEPYLDRVEIFIITDARARATALQAGDIDVAVVDSPLLAQTLRREPHLEVAVLPSTMTIHYHMNTRREPLNDPRVRRAISAAIDRQEITDIVFLGDGQPGGPIPSAVSAFMEPTHALPFYQTDRELARQLLAEAGYPDGFSMGITVTSAFESHIQMAEIIQDQLAEIGVRLDIQLMEWAAFIDTWLTEKDFDSLIIFSSTGRDPDANFGRRFLSTSPRNTTGYVNPLVDELIQMGQVTVDPAQRFEIYKALQVLMAYDVPKLWIVEPPQYEIWNTRVQNWIAHPLGFHYHLGQVWLSD